MAYSVWSLGEVATGYDRADVRTRLVETFSLQPAQADRLLQQPCRLKLADDPAEAQRYARALTALGVQVQVRHENGEAAREAPAQQPTAGASRGPGLGEQALRGALSQAIPPAKPSAAYAVSLAFTVLVTLIAPLLYLALVAGLVAGLALYYLHLPDWLAGSSPGVPKLLMLFAPALVLGIPILFLLRPLFSRYRRPFEFTLKRKRAPLLFALVDSLAASMSLAPPTRIVVNNQANAAAASDSLGALLAGRRKLVIGLPLVAGLDVTQLAGVLAHEFGHFTQRTSSITYYLVAQVNGWFHSRAYQQDQWERRIDSWLESNTGGELLFAIPLWVTGQLIQLIKWVFGLLFRVNYRVSSAMLRQMEYDADRYEAYLGGSAGFAGTSLMINRLMAAADTVVQTNQVGWRDGKLIADVPAAVRHARDAQTPLGVDEITRAMNDREPTPWDTHPPDRQRIRRAEALGHPGLLRFDQPATELFVDFDELCGDVTLFEYRQMGIEKPEQYTRADSELHCHEQQRQAEDFSVEAFFDGRVYPRLMQLTASPGKQPPLDWQGSIDKLSELATEFEQRAGRYFERLDRLAARSLQGQMARHQMRDDALFGDGDPHNGADPGTLIKAAERELDESQALLDRVDRLFLHRMHFAIESLGPADRARSDQLLGALNGLRRHCLAPLRDLRCQQVGLAQGNHWRQHGGAPRQLRDLVEGYRQRTDTALRVLLQATDSIDDPTADAARKFGDTLRQRCGHLPDRSVAVDGADLLAYCDQLLNQFWYLYFRLLGELCGLCLGQEQRHGIVPLRITFGQP